MKVSPGIWAFLKDLYGGDVESIPVQRFPGQGYVEPYRLPDGRWAEVEYDEQGHVVGAQIADPEQAEIYEETLRMFNQFQAVLDRIGIDMDIRMVVEMATERYGGVSIGIKCSLRFFGWGEDIGALEGWREKNPEREEKMKRLFAELLKEAAADEAWKESLL